MTRPIEREAILPRIDGIRKNVARLEKLGQLPFKEFESGDSFELVQHHLRLALEGVFHIGSHLLSRMPGGRAVEYREIAEKLGELGIVDKQFAQEKLVPMAKLRNLLVHQYADLDSERIYVIIREHLQDVEVFLRSVRTIMDHPEKFGMTVE